MRKPANFSSGPAAADCNLAARPSGNSTEFFRTYPRESPEMEIWIHIIGGGFEKDARALRVPGVNGSAGFLDHKQICRMRLASLDLLKILEFSGELLNTLFAGDALVAKGGDFIGLLRGLRKRRSHSRGGTRTGKIQLGLRRLRGIRGRGSGGNWFAGELFFQAIEKIKFEAAIGRKDLIAGFGDVAIGVQRGDFCGEANDGGSGAAGNQFDGELVEAAFVAVEGIIGASDETVEDGKLLAGVGLQIFQGLLDLRTRHGETSGVRDGLRVCSSRETCKIEKEKKYFGKTERVDLQGNCSRRSWGSHPRWPSGVSTPSQRGVTMRMTTSVNADSVLRLAADWNGAAFRSAPGVLTRRSSSWCRALTCCSSSFCADWALLKREVSSSRCRTID